MSGDNNNAAKLITVLDYFSVFCLFGLFIQKEHTDVKFHTNQGLLLTILEFVGLVVFSILQLLPFVGGVFRLMGLLFALTCLLLSLCGLIHAIREEKKPLPVIGSLFNLIQ